MSPLKLLRIWLLALVVVLVGCGGHDDTDIDELDASSDRRSDVVSDRASDTTGDNRDVATNDVRVDPGIDVRVDTTPPPVDVRVDVRVDTTPPPVDVRVDPAIDVRVDTPVIDVRNDPTVIDVRVDPAVDVRNELPVFDVRNDPTADIRPTEPDAGGCTSDNQCTNPQLPHCNTSTGACVSRVALSVTPANPSIAAGTTQQFIATITYGDNSTGDVTALATWLSSNTAVATMAPGTPGLATGVTPGPTTISAAYAGLPAGTLLTVTTAVLVSIQVTPANASSPLGTTQQFTATGNYTDNSTQNLTATATWASSVPATATIAPGGLATTVAVGAPTQISATSGGITGTVTFTVTSPTLVRIDVSPPNATILTLTTQDYTATGIYTDNSQVPLSTQVTWASTAPAVATLATTSSGATATGISAGTTDITATFGTITGSTPLTVTGATLTSIDVTPLNPSAPVGYNVQFKATGHFSMGPDQDLTPDVLWTSGDDTRASISNAGGSEGLASALQAGTSNITATLVGVTGASLLTVTTSPLTSITVAPAAPSIALGTKQIFTATAHFMDGSSLDVTEQASWSSSALGVATVSNATGTKGLATSVTVGMATITAALGGANGSAMLNVTAAVLVSIAVTPTAATANVGDMINYIATGTYSDATTQIITTLVTWSSTNTGVATISTGSAGTEGVANAVASGDTTIQATLSGVAGTTSLHVN